MLKTIVVVEEHVVAGVGRLLGHLDVFLAPRLERDRLVGRGEDAQQAGHHRQHGVAHLGHDDLAAAGLLGAGRAGAERIAAIVGGGPAALLGDGAVDEVGGVGQGRLDGAEILLVVHHAIERQALVELA